MLEIRTATPSDRDGIRALWRLCFEDSPGFIDWFFRERYYPAYTACLLEDGVIMSAMQGSPMHLHIREQTLPALMLAGVSTHPERGGRGYMRKTFMHFMQIAVNARIPIVFHTPAHMPTFFSRGHFPASDTLWLTQETGQTTNTKEALPEGVLPHPMSEGLDALHAHYQAIAARYSGSISRSMADFSFKFRDYAADGAKCFVARRDGAVSGYCVYYAGADQLHAEEFLADTPDTYARLLDALRFEAQGRKLRCKLPPDVSQDARWGGAEIRQQGAMGAADISWLLKELIRDSGFVFEVEDQTVPQNNGIWDGLGRAAAAKNPQVKLPCGRLMQLLLGYRSLSELADEGNAVILDARAAKALDELLPVKPCFVVDEY